MNIFSQSANELLIKGQGLFYFEKWTGKGMQDMLVHFSKRIGQGYEMFLFCGKNSGFTKMNCIHLKFWIIRGKQVNMNERKS